MLGFVDVPTWEQMVVLVLLSIDLVIMLQVFITSIQCNTGIVRITVNGFFLCGTVFVLGNMSLGYRMNHQQSYRGYYPTRLNSYIFSELSSVRIWILWTVGMLILVLGLAEFIFIMKNKRPSYDIIKEAMDNLPLAVCYFTEIGEVKLCNLKMYEAYRLLTGKYLRSLEDLRKAVDDIRVDDAIAKYRDEPDILKFGNGKVYRYEENLVTASKGRTYTEAVFMEITEFYNLGLELNDQTGKLKKMSEELKELSDNAIRLIRENETLRAKTRLHDQMGTALIAVRKQFQENDITDDSNAAVGLLKQAVRDIEKDNNYYMGKNRVDDFLWNAHAVGIEPEISGAFPEDEEVKTVFFMAMQECLTNAAKHGQADKMTIRTGSDDEGYYIIISNNGTYGDNPPVPKGGLVNLEKYVKRLNGNVGILTEGELCVEVRIPAV